MSVMTAYDHDEMVRQLQMKLFEVGNVRNVVWLLATARDVSEAAAAYMRAATPYPEIDEKDLKQAAKLLDGLVKKAMGGNL